MMVMPSSSHRKARPLAIAVIWDLKHLPCKGNRDEGEKKKKPEETRNESALALKKDTTMLTASEQ